METQKNLKSQYNLKRSTNLDILRSLISNYTTNLESSEQYGIGTKEKHRDPWNRTESTEINPHFMVSSSMTEEVRIYNGEKIASSITVLGKLDSYMHENQTGILSHTIYKNLKMNQILQCKT